MVVVVSATVVGLMAATVAAPVAGVRSGVRTSRSGAIVVSVGMFLLCGIGLLSASDRGYLGDALGLQHTGAGTAGWAIDVRQWATVGSVLSLFLVVFLLALPRAGAYFMSSAPEWARPLDTE
jgi:hypothetical protein